MKKSDLLKIAKPILFNTDMVRAILEGHKTQTRRVRRMPYCKKGDILYVRETWNYGYWDSSDFEYQVNETWFEELPIGKKTALGEGHYVYRANIEPQDLKNLEYKHEDGNRGICWHPSIHMPKEAARIFLKVTNVRFEWLQDISLQDALNEGAKLSARGTIEEGREGALKPFAKLWDSTTPKRLLDKCGWDANPYVMVIEFERLEE